MSREWPRGEMIARYKHMLAELEISPQTPDVVRLKREIFGRLVRLGAGDSPNVYAFKVDELPGWLDPACIAKEVCDDNSIRIYIMGTELGRIDAKHVFLTITGVAFVLWEKSGKDKLTRYYMD